MKLNLILGYISVFFTLATNDRGYGLWAFDGLREHSMSWNDKVNVEAIPVNSTSAKQCVLSSLAVVIFLF
ncbi:MAG: hypothetical protein PHT07_14440 [Paludibacter sp.]|nr:hypothetical protein [Paludibacter sp.]